MGFVHWRRGRVARCTALARVAEGVRDEMARQAVLDIAVSEAGTDAEMRDLDLPLEMTSPHAHLLQRVPSLVSAMEAADGDGDSSDDSSSSSSSDGDDSDDSSSDGATSSGVSLPDSIAYDGEAQIPRARADVEDAEEGGPVVVGFDAAGGRRRRFKHRRG